jgi:hypothetical protein
MKKILKHLKKNWIRHAFDTLVVIIGVLIAFTLSDWNENKIINNNRISYLERLKNDLIGDNENLVQLIESRKVHIRHVEHFTVLFNSGKYNLIQLKDSINQVGYGLHRYIPLDITYNELINSGQIGLLNEEIRISLAELDRIKDQYVIINAQTVNSIFAQRKEVKKYWNLTQLNFVASLGIESNDEDLLKGLRLEVNLVMDGYSWNLNSIDRYEEIIKKNSALITLVDLLLKRFG